MLMPTARTRVAVHTPNRIKRQLREDMYETIEACALAGPAAIEERLSELDCEWDMERAIEANASSLILMGLLLGATVDRRFYALPAAVAGFLLQHAVQGWCPPVPLLRRLGVRTTEEIEAERYALRIIRGDFDGRTTTNPEIEDIADAALEHRL